MCLGRLRQLESDLSKRGLSAADRLALRETGVEFLGHRTNIHPHVVRVEGLRAGNSSLTGTTGPRPGHVYLFREGKSPSITGGRWVYLVDWSILPRFHFAVDEDHYFGALTFKARPGRQMKPVIDPADYPPSVHLRLHGQLAPAGNGPTAGEWIEQYARQLDSWSQVRRSLDEGSVAFNGVVPARAIPSYFDTHKPGTTKANIWPPEALRSPLGP